MQLMNEKVIHKASFIYLFIAVKLYAIHLVVGYNQLNIYLKIKYNLLIKMNVVIWSVLIL